METVLQKKLQEVVDKTGMSLVEIARNTGTSKENIYKWRRGTKPSDSYAYNRMMTYLEDILINIPGISLEELNANYAMMHDAGPHFISQREMSSMIKVSLRQLGKPTPLNSSKGVAGSLIFTKDEPELILNRIDAPFLGEIDGVIEIVGDSMEPTFRSGTQIAIIRLREQTMFNWGAYYFIVDKNHQCVVRRLYAGASENSLVMISDHEKQTKHPPIVRTLDQVEAIFIVKACIVKM